MDLRSNNYFISGVLFRNIAESGNGGALFLSRISINVSLICNSFEWCRLTDSASTGGAIFAYANSVLLEKFVFERCYAYDSGSAFHVRQNSRSISASSFSISKTYRTEYNIIQDVFYVHSTKENTVKNGNMSECRIKQSYIFCLYPPRGVKSYVSFMNFEHIDTPTDGICYFAYSAELRNCNFFHLTGRTLFNTENNPMVDLLQCSFFEVLVSIKVSGDSYRFSYSGCSIPNSTLATLLEVSNYTVDLTINGVKVNQACSDSKTPSISSSAVNLGIILVFINISSSKQY